MREKLEGHELLGLDKPRTCPVCGFVEERAGETVVWQSPEEVAEVPLWMPLPPSLLACLPKTGRICLLKQAEEWKSKNRDVVPE